MKIGLFIPNATFDLPGSAEVGGIEVYAFELGEALQARGHEVILFGGQPRSGKQHRPTTLRLSLHPWIETQRIWKLGTRFRKLVQRLHFASASMAAVVQIAPEVMFVFKPYDFINAARWKRKLPNLRVVMNYQGKDFFPTDSFWKRYIDWDYAASDDNAELARQRYGTKPQVFPNAVNTSLFHPRKYERTPGPLRILTAGRLVGWKGLPILLEALKLVPDLELWIAGDGPEQKNLSLLASKLQIATRVRFLGVLSPEKLAHIMQEADLFAQPSIDFDACPTAVLQALSSGLLVLMSDQVGLKTYFPSPTAAWQIPARVVTAWAQALQAATTADRQQIGLEARQIIELHFSWSAAAETLDRRLQKLLNPPLS